MFLRVITALLMFLRVITALLMFLRVITALLMFFRVITVGYYTVILYSMNSLRTINFAVFVDFTATSKINPRKSYYNIQMQ